MSRKTSQVGTALIKSFEGCRLTAYKPVVTETHYTIGWGHYGADVKQGATITQAQADSMLVNDLAKYESYVNNTAYVPITAQLNQNQFDALTSFCYNCGASNLQTLCKGRTLAQIADSITKYDKAGGNVLAGLVRRRKAELDLFNKPDVPINVEKEVVKVDKVNVTVYGKKIEDGLIVDGKTYVPLRAVGDALGVKTAWDNNSKTASITK